MYSGTPKQKTAIITGGANGIGRAMVLAFLSGGYSVVAIDTDSDALSTLGHDCSQTTNTETLHLFEGDAGLEQTWAPLRNGFTEAAVLINNAGISPKHDGKKPEVDQISLESWNEVFRVNLTSALLGVHAVLPLMKRHGSGRIINISSQAGRTASPIAGSHYAASKAGLIGFTRSLALELAPHHITVNAIAPGRIDTPMSGAPNTAVNVATLASTPLGRFGEPSEVAAAAVFLAGPDSSFITGATIDINGGKFIG